MGAGHCKQTELPVFGAASVPWVRRRRRSPARCSSRHKFCTAQHIWPQEPGQVLEDGKKKNRGKCTHLEPPSPNAVPKNSVFFFFLRLLGSGDKNPAERAPGCHAHGAVVPLVPPRVVPVPAAPRVGAHSPSHPDVSLLPWPWLRRRPAARGNLKPQESVALRAQVHPLRSLAQLQALVCFRD